MGIVILEIAGQFWAFVPPQKIREPFPSGRFFEKFSTEQAAVDFIFGAWSDA